jgi:fucokinase
MKQKPVTWDYLIVTASNDAQAGAYKSQLALRRRLGLLSSVRHVMVVADPGGRRVGSGGSTIYCLMEVVNRELAGKVGQASSLSPKHRAKVSPETAGRQDAHPTLEVVESILRRQRILIVHAGGDSRRLPAYGPCGKIFIPVPGESKTALGMTLFDRLAPAFLNLPAGCEGSGQVIMAAGDALILFDPSNVSLAQPGLTALACPATPEDASKHGVFCAGSNQQVRLYLQKPDPAEQHRYRAVNGNGNTLLDVGVMSFDSTMALALFEAFGIKPCGKKLLWSAAARRGVLARGVDFFREICCAMGAEATMAQHQRQARGAGSSWSGAGLKQIFRALAGVPFHLQTVPEVRFLHFGTTRQLIASGSELRQNDSNAIPSAAPLSLNNEIQSGGKITGSHAWIEGCRLCAPLELSGQNVVIGIDVDEPLALPEGACLDVLRGRNRAGKSVWFIRGYSIEDTFKDPITKGGTFCGWPLLQWLAEVGARAADVWERNVPTNKRSLWDARIFPAEAKPGAYRRWLWLFDPTHASLEQKRAFLTADLYSAAEIAVLADQKDFFARRRALHCRSK